MIKDTIQAVKDAEAKAAEIVSDAWEKSDAIYHQSQEDAEKIRENGKKQARDLIAHAQSQSEEKGKRDLKAAKTRAEIEAKAMVSYTEPKMQAAVDAVVEAILN
ncbi:MAG: hypothetical protein ACOYBC_11235 [Bilifractor sp.]|jgi:V/A-type H+-transporting ATPase subunit G/H